MSAIVGQVFHFEFSHARIKIAVHVGSVGVMISKLVMQYIISIIPVDAQKYIRYVEMIEKEIALLKGWRKSDNKILKKIRENEAAKAQKEGASQKAEKQV